MMIIHTRRVDIMWSEILVLTIFHVLFMCWVIGEGGEGRAAPDIRVRGHPTGGIPGRARVSSGGDRSHNRVPATIS